MRRLVALTGAVALSLALSVSAQRPGPTPPARRGLVTLADSLSTLALGGNLAPRALFESPRRLVAPGSALAVPVTIRTRGDAGTLARALGLAPRNARGTVAEAFVSPEQLRALAGSSDVIAVEPVIADRPRVLSEGLAVHNVPGVHGRGFTGAGVKVGVIDSFLGFRALQGIELPTSIVVRCYPSIGQVTTDPTACDTGSSHGTAVAETLMDVAPAAQLYIANPISRLDFMDAMNWMAAAGVKVINYSAARPWDGPGDGSSPYIDSPMRAVDQAVAGGAVFVAAAGNEGEATWYGPFADASGDGFHEFGSVNYNSVSLAAGWTYALQLRWQDSWAASTRDLDVALYNANFQLVAASTAPQTGMSGHVPFEFLIYTPAVSGTYHIGVFRRAGTAPGWLQMQSFTGEPLVINSHGAYSIGSPADTANPGALAVGAAAWNTPNVLESFSSQGPTPDGRTKPDVVGVDRATTVTYGVNGFAGTSQASPHVAGLVALIRQEFPAMTPAQAADYLEAAADPRNVKPNHVWGHGLAVGCSYDVSPTSQILGDGTVAGGVTVTTVGKCPWAASSSTPWISVEDTAGSGTSPVHATFVPNPLAIERVGSMTVAGRTVTLTQVAPSDLDGDTLPDAWEQSYGLNAASAAGADGAAGDPDGDGRTNAQEAVDRTHPRGTFTRYLAEGVSSNFFSTRIALFNPGAQPATVLARYTSSTGRVRPSSMTLPASSRTVLEPDPTLLGLKSSEFSVAIESDVPIAVDRTMTWPVGAPYGSHSEVGIRAPATTWHLAEGATHSGFQLFYLLQNPSTTSAATMRVRYLLASGAPVEKTYAIAPSTRFTIWANTIPELRDVDVSAVFESTNGVPIVVERAMYLTTSGRTFEAGHESAGVTTPNLNWFFAEGATGTYFDEFLLLANPDARAAAVTVRFLLATGAVISKQYTVPATSRFTVWVDTVDARLADAAVSAQVSVTNGVPIVAERAMWWPGPTSATWREAHNSAGATTTALKWAMAEGEDGGLYAQETYVLVANPSAAPATVRVQVFGPQTSVEKTYAIPATSRFNVPIRTEFPSMANQQFSVLVESLGTTPAPLVVERAHYGTFRGERWSMGSNALAMPWP